MKKIGNREFKIGIVTIICLLILFFGIDYLKGINILKPENYFYVKYKNVAGLSVTGAVNLDGYKVGIIRDITYDYSDPGNILVEISIDKKLKLPHGSKAVIVPELLGSAFIELKLDSNKNSFYNVGDTLKGENNFGIMDEVSNMIPTVEKLLPKIDSILSGLDNIVNHSNLKETFVNLNSIDRKSVG